MAKAIPEGFHTLTPHLAIKGASDAIEFYKRAFGAVETRRIPAPGLGPDGQVRLMHAELKIGDSHLFLADEFPEYCSAGPIGASPVTLHFFVEDADAAFDRAVEAGAEVSMPLMDAFWGDRYGQILDPFGHRWSIAQHKEDLTTEQLRERMAACFAPKLVEV